jgi:O-antigen ligase
MCLFIGLATLNRFFWPAAVLALLIAFVPLYRRHVTGVLIVALVAGVLGMAMLEYSTRLRFGELVPPPGASDIAIGDYRLPLPKALIAIGNTDVRPDIWEFYLQVGQRHFWLGTGFGKPLPGMAYRDDLPPELGGPVEEYVLTHAHNLFLNTWLQAGVPGLALHVALLSCLAWRFWKLRSIDTWLCTAGLALIAGMLVKNMTDDFMWRTTMLAFWSFAGLLLGVGEKNGRLALLKHDAGAG